MTKIRKIFKRADRGKHWTSKQTRSTNSMSVLAFRTTHTMFFVCLLLLFFCQANSNVPKVEQVFPYATCNNHLTVVLFVDWSIMKLMIQFGKVQLYGLMRSIEYSYYNWQGVWVAEVPPNQASGRISPMPPYVFGSWNDGKIILMSLRYQ